MNAREKKLAIIVLSMGGLFAGLFGFKFYVTEPLRKLDRDNANLLNELGKARQARQAFFRDEKTLGDLSARTFSDEVELASASSGAMLTKEIIRSGLEEANFTRLPVGPRKMRAALEIGWSIQGIGPLDRVINLIYVLDKSPHFHRLDQLTFTPGDTPDTVRVRFNYLTLVMRSGPDVEFLELEEKPDLQGDGRKRYDLIVARDLLNPYIPPPPPPPPPPPKPKSEPPPSTPSGPGPETFRVVSLTEWKGQPEIHVRDLTKNKTLRYKPGDELAGGKVVMIDYRPLPKAGHEGLKSFSRVILNIGGDIWAIEKGQTLADKYQMAAESLPPGLPGS